MSEGGFVRLPEELMSQRPGSLTHSPAWEASGLTVPEVRRTFMAPHPGGVNGASVRLVAWRLCLGSWEGRQFMSRVTHHKSEQQTLRGQQARAEDISL